MFECKFLLEGIRDRVEDYTTACQQDKCPHNTVTLPRPYFSCFVRWYCGLHNQGMNSSRIESKLAFSCSTSSTWRRHAYTCESIRVAESFTRGYLIGLTQ